MLLCCSLLQPSNIAASCRCKVVCTAARACTVRWRYKPYLAPLANLHALAVELGLHHSGMAVQFAVRVLHAAGHRRQHRPGWLPRRQVLRIENEGKQ
jgi:hypothetical protein